MCDQDVFWALRDPSSSRPLTLCLHQRDFLPGRWVLDNIMAAMESSRRTVFVLSENFVHSEWCRFELDFSHFWMFDGAGGDAAVLVLLEPLKDTSVPRRFCRLHRLLRSTTYLEWPQQEDKVEAFWRSLRSAVRGGGGVERKEELKEELKERKELEGKEEELGPVSRLA